MNRTEPQYVSQTGIDAPEPVAATQLGVRQLVDIVARRWLLLVAITLGVLAATIVATLLMTPQYDALARLKIDPAQRVVTDEGAERTTSPQADQSRIDTEVQILQSRDIVAQVVRDLNLINDPEFADPSSSAAAQGGKAALDEVITAVDKNLSVTRESDNYIVNVGFRSENAAKAAAIANAFADHYLSNSVERRTGTAARQSEFLDQRLGSLGSDLESLEARIARYRSESGIVQGGTQGTITDQQVAPLATQLAQAEAEAAAARANLSAARQQMARGNIGAVSSVLTSNVIADLRRQRSDASREQAQVNARYGARHPESIRVAEQLANIDASLRDEAGRIVAGLEAASRAADASAGSLRGELGRLRGQQAVNTRASVAADALERQAKAKQAMYDQLAQSAQQTGQSRRNDEATATVIETAVAPLRPSTPNKPLFAALGAILGLIVGFSTILLIEFLTNTVRSGEDIERRLGLPFLVSIPRLTPSQMRSSDGSTVDPSDFVLRNPMSTYAEALRTIRNTLLLGTTPVPRVVAIVSSLPSEGKTTTALSLARVMALSGDRVILVDCDLRRGGVLAGAVANAAGGLVEVLNGDAIAEQTIVKDPSSALDILPLRAPSFTSVDLFGGDRFRELLTDLAGRYDFVVLDTAPALAVADSRIVASLADTSIMVVRTENTPSRAARAAIDLLRQDGTRVVGGALTMTEKPKRLGANDPAYYYAKYRAYHQG